MTPEDRLAVQDLLARYAWALDTGDYQTYASLYTPDGVFVERGVEYRGRDAIREHVRELVGRMAPGNRHHNTQILFEASGEDWCRLRSYSTHIYQPEPGSPPQVRMQGWYCDLCVKLEGAWYFAERRWDEWYPDRPEEYRLTQE